MIYVDGQVLNEAHPNKQAFEFYKSKLASIGKKKRPIVIKTSKPLQFAETFSSNGRSSVAMVQNKRSTSFKLKDQFTMSSGLTNLWALSSDGRLNGVSVSYTIRENKILHPGTSDNDLIFYLTYISSMVRNGSFIIEDKEKEAKLRNMREDAKADVLYLIRSRFSPISPNMLKGDEKTYRTIASSWGVIGAAELGFEQLKEALLTKVEWNEQNKNRTGRGYEEFIADVNQGGNQSKVNELRDEVYQAITDKILVYTEPEWTWYGEQVIFEVPPHLQSTQYEKALFDYIANTNGFIQELELEKKGGKKISAYDVDSMSYDELKHHIKKRGGKMLKQGNSQKGALNTEEARVLLKTLIEKE